jgi:Cell division protein FtsI/penicillin-binding protein 2
LQQRQCFFWDVGEVFSLQIRENKKYLTLSIKIVLGKWRLPPVRGEFLDYFGNTIAGNLKSLSTACLFPNK